MLVKQVEIEEKLNAVIRDLNGIASINYDATAKEFIVLGRAIKEAVNTEEAALRVEAPSEEEPKKKEENSPSSGETES